MLELRRERRDVRVGHRRRREQFGRAQKRRRRRRLRLLDRRQYRVVRPLANDERGDVRQRHRGRAPRLAASRARHGALAVRLAAPRAPRQRPGARGRAQRARLRVRARERELGRTTKPRSRARIRGGPGARGERSGSEKKRPGSSTPRSNPERGVVRLERLGSLGVGGFLEKRHLAADENRHRVAPRALAPDDAPLRPRLELRRLEHANEVPPRKVRERGHVLHRARELLLERRIQKRRAGGFGGVVPRKRGNHRAAVRVPSVRPRRSTKRRRALLAGPPLERPREATLPLVARSRGEAPLPTERLRLGAKLPLVRVRRALANRLGVRLGSTRRVARAERRRAATRPGRHRERGRERGARGG